MQSGSTVYAKTPTNTETNGAAREDHVIAVVENVSLNVPLELQVVAGFCQRGEGDSESVFSLEEHRMLAWDAGARHEKSLWSGFDTVAESEVGSTYWSQLTASN